MQVPISQLRPAEYNPRKSNKKETADLVASIKEFGLVDPIIVNGAKERKNIIIGGHFRLRAMAELGFAEAPVIYVNVPTEEKERELNLRLNKNTGQWDWDMLAQFDDTLLKTVGFTSEEMDKILERTAQEDDFDAEEAYGAIDKPKTKAGDVYLLGTHKLLCGDSSLPSSYLTLLGAEKADMCFTDPPFNVNYDYAAYKKSIRGLGLKSNNRRKVSSNEKVFSDQKTPAEFQSFLAKVFGNVYLYTADSAPLYVCHATKTQEQFFSALSQSGYHFSQTIIWIKERIILSLGQDFHRIYEPIWYGWKSGKKHYTNRELSKSSEVWLLDRLNFETCLDAWYVARDKSKDYEHPTQKPVRLVERAIRKSSQEDSLLIEPFGGSGSTLLAAEQTGRRCYSIELDPKYCDVIVMRWEKFTGEKAKLVK